MTIRTGARLCLRDILPHWYEADEHVVGIVWKYFRLDHMDDKKLAEIFAGDRNH